MQFEERAPRHVLRKPAVKARIGVTADSTLYDLMAAGLFPRPINIGPRAVGWIESEVDDWITARMAERDPPLTSEGTPTTRARQAAPRSLIDGTPSTRLEPREKRQP